MLDRVQSTGLSALWPLLCLVFFAATAFAGQSTPVVSTPTLSTPYVYADLYGRSSDGVEIHIDKSGGKVHLSWNDEGSNKYQVWRGVLAAPFDTAVQIAEVRHHGIEYFDDALNDGQNYYYFVVPKK